MAEFDPQINPDAQEALSIRYRDGLRVLLLSSGNWAILSSDGLLHIGPTLREDLMRDLYAEHGEPKFRQMEWREPEGSSLVAEKNAEDLGL